MCKAPLLPCRHSAHGLARSHAVNIETSTNDKPEKLLWLATEKHLPKAGTKSAPMWREKDAVEVLPKIRWKVSCIAATDRSLRATPLPRLRASSSPLKARGIGRVRDLLALNARSQQEQSETTGRGCWLLGAFLRPSKSHVRGHVRAPFGLTFVRRIRRKHNRSVVQVPGFSSSPVVRAQIRAKPLKTCRGDLGTTQRAVCGGAADHLAHHAPAMTSPSGSIGNCLSARRDCARRFLFSQPSF